MEKTVNSQIPLLFQKIKTFETEDTRFLKVKIWLMHLGANLNGSHFSKEVVEKALPTLANTPILAYIEDNSDGEKDFSDHRMVLVKENGDFKVRYIGQAIGIIPETNNAQFEMRLCDDGVEREFVTCDGLIWSSKWDDPIDIFNRDIIKSQSMELHDNYEGYWNEEDSLYHFSSFQFYGACALGDALPAMRSASIEAQFSQDKVFNHVQEKMEQFKQAFSMSKGGKEEMEDVKQEETEFVEVTEEIVENVVETEVAEEVVEIVEPVEEVVEIDYKAEYEAMKLTLENLESTYATLEQEVVSLREFKSQKVTAERVEKEQEIFESFATELTEDEMKDVKSNVSEYTLEQLEEKLFTLVGKKKATFSKQPKKEKQATIKIEVENTVEEPVVYGGLFDKFSNN